MPRNRAARALLAALFISVCYAFYRGFHAAGLWTVNYYQAGYFDGFSRRALLGTLFTPFGCLRFDYFFIEPMQFLVLCAGLGLLLYHGIKNREYAALAVFFVSAAGGYFFDEVGYPEQFLWLLAAATLYALKHDRNFLAATCLCLAIMVHEMALLSVLPLVLAWWAMQKKETVRSGMTIFLPPLLVFVILTAWFQTVPDSITARYFETASNCGYPVMRKDYFDIYHSQFAGDNAKRFSYGADQFITAVMPVLALAGVLVFSIRKKLGLSPLRQTVIGLCCVSPLLLGIFGSDSERWIFIAFSQIIVIGLFASSRVREASAILSGSLPFMAALVLVAAVLRLHYFYGEPRPLTLVHLGSFANYVIDQITNPFY
jgi:hypothetical protein